VRVKRLIDLRLDVGSQTVLGTRGPNGTAGELVTGVRNRFEATDTRSGGGDKRRLDYRFGTPSPRPGERVIYKCATYE
jgi:hypothetical protein